VPVLAEKTVESAGLVENCQILVPVFGPRAVRPLWVSRAASTRTDPVGDTIRRQWVEIPGHRGPFGGAARDVSVFILPHATVTPTSDGYSTLITAKPALSAAGGRRNLAGKTELLAASRVNPTEFRQTGFVGLAYAVSTK